MPVSESNHRAPLVIDGLTLARTGAECNYQFRDQRFERLTGLVVSDQPALDVTLRMGLLQGKPFVRGQLQGAVELICQRCLRPMPLLLDESFELLVCGAGEVIADFDDEQEVEHRLAEIDEWVADPTRMDVIELVEEQVILALPLVPKHDDERACSVFLAAAATAGGKRLSEELGERIEIGTDVSEGRRRPFANLRDLLNK